MPRCVVAKVLVALRPPPRVTSCEASTHRVLQRPTAPSASPRSTRRSSPAACLAGASNLSATPCAQRRVCRSRYHGAVRKTPPPHSYACSYEWVTTPAFKASNPEHQRIKKDIEVGDGLPDITDGNAVSDTACGCGCVR